MHLKNWKHVYDVVTIAIAYNDVTQPSSPRRGNENE